MVEPHVFCSPEFLLEVPKVHADTVGERSPTGTATAEDGVGAAGAGWTVSAASLLTFQSELYGVCTPGLRRRLHRPVLTSPLGAKAMQENNVKEVANMLMYAADAATGQQQRFGGGGGALAAPSELQFLTAKATGTLTREEEASIAQTLKVIRKTAADDGPADAASSDFLYLPILITDSRMAGELYLLCLRNTSIALSQGCRLYNYYRATARAASIDPADILRKKEAQRSRYNLDSDLWSALELAVTPELIEDVLARKRKTDEEGNRYPPGRILTPREEHQQRVEAVLQYCEANVSYAGVLDIREEASPLLIAMGLFFRLHLTLGDLYTHFVRHARRAVRALALLIARYTLAPEELAPFFYPSLHDGVVIATTADAQVTCAMSEFAKATLTNDEVSEAWLPVYHPFYMESVVVRAMDGMAWLWRKQLEAREQRRTGVVAAAGEAEQQRGEVDRGDAEEEEEDGVPRTRARVQAAAGTSGERAMSDEVRGSGRGVAALGFSSLRALNEFAKQQERSLLPQSMSTLLASRYSRRRQRDDALALLDEGNNDDDGSGGDRRDEDVEYMGSDAESNSSDGEFLIHVDVQGGGDNDGDSAGGAAPLPSSRFPRKGKEATSSQQQQQQQAQRQGNASDDPQQEPSRKTRRREERLDPHAAILKEGYRLVLDLLGRRQPFDRREERYLEF